MTAVVTALYGLALLPYAFFFGVAVYHFMAPGYDRLSGRAFVEFFLAIDPYMKVRARSAMLGLIALTLPLPVLTKGVPFALTLAALALALVMMVIAIRGNVPLNRQMDRWSPDDPPPGWDRVRDRWLRFHALRGFAAVAGFVFLLTAALIDRPAPPREPRAGPPVARRTEATVFLPLTDNDGRSFAREPWDAALAELVRPFGGATVGNPQEGCWKDDRGRIVREPVCPVVVSFARGRLGEFRSAAESAGRRLGQAVVYVRFEETGVDLIAVGARDAETR